MPEVIPRGTALKKSKVRGTECECAGKAGDSTVWVPDSAKRREQVQHTGECDTPPTLAMTTCSIEPAGETASTRFRY